MNTQNFISSLESGMQINILDNVYMLAVTLFFLCVALLSVAAMNREYRAKLCMYKNNIYAGLLLLVCATASILLVNQLLGLEHGSYLWMTLNKVANESLSYTVLFFVNSPALMQLCMNLLVLVCVIVVAIEVVLFLPVRILLEPREFHEFMSSRISLLVSMILWALLMNVLPYLHDLYVSGMGSVISQTESFRLLPLYACMYIGFLICTPMAAFSGMRFLNTPRLLNTPL